MHQVPRALRRRECVSHRPEPREVVVRERGSALEHALPAARLGEVEADAHDVAGVAAVHEPESEHRLKLRRLFVLVLVLVLSLVLDLLLISFLALLILVFVFLILALGFGVLGFLFFRTLFRVPFRRALDVWRGVCLGHEHEVVVSKLSHGFLAEDELDDVEAVESFGREHGADVGRARVAFLSPAHLRRALFEHERLEDVEVLVDGCEGFRDFAQGPPRGGARVVLAAHAVVVPR